MLGLWNPSINEQTMSLWPLSQILHFHVSVIEGQGSAHARWRVWGRDYKRMVWQLFVCSVGISAELVIKVFILHKVCTYCFESHLPRCCQAAGVPAMPKTTKTIVIFVSSRDILLSLPTKSRKSLLLTFLDLRRVQATFTNASNTPTIQNHNFETLSVQCNEFDIRCLQNSVIVV